MIYAKLMPLFNRWRTLMFTLKINDTIVSQTTDQNIAWTNYRSAGRNYKNKAMTVALFDDDQLLHKKNKAELLLEEVGGTSTNDVLNIVMQRLDIDILKLKAILADSDLHLTNSRIDGWIRPATDRKFVEMHNDELAVVIDLMLKNFQSSIKSPKTIIEARKKLGWTQQQLAENLDMKSGFRQVANWESGSQEMPDARWKKLQEFLK